MKKCENCKRPFYVGEKKVQIEDDKFICIDCMIKMNGFKNKTIEKKI